MPIVELLAAPRGRPSGLAAASHGSLAASVLVLPKLWLLRPPQGVGSAQEPTVKGAWNGSSLHVTLYEGEHCVVDCTEDQAELLHQLGDRCEAEAESTDSERCPLLTVRPGRRPARSVPRQVDLEAALVSLLALAALAESAGTKQRTVAPAKGDGALVQCGRGATTDPITPLLQHWEFLREVESRISEVRRGYVAEADWLAMIKGRVTSRGLAHHVGSGGPSVECEFDEFTDATPLFRVVVTAVDRVAAGRSALIRGGWRLTARITEKAVALRRHLCGIPSLPAGTAVALGTGLRLPRQLSGWTPALELALSILREEPPILAAPVPSEPRSLVWWVRTEKLWEQLLVGASAAHFSASAVKNGNSAAVKGAKGVFPWIDLGTTKPPDVVVDVEGQGWIFDAKYKFPDAEIFVPASSDQFQIFAYSHLWPDIRRRYGMAAELLTGCALVYPTPASPLGRSRSWARGPDSTAARPCLHVLRLEFPSQNQAMSRERYQRWLRSTGAALAEGLGLGDGCRR